MRVINIMLGKGLGGIEQAFVDYGNALRMAGHEVVMVTHPDAQIIEKVTTQGFTVEYLSNKGWWDWIAPKVLAHIAHKYQSDVVVAHGNRAMIFAKRALKGNIPLIGVAHNYKHQHLVGLDGVFAITQHMAQTIAALPNAPKVICVMPNMMTLEAGAGGVRRVWKSPPVIGALGRFVSKKGFDVYLEALAQLKMRGYEFRAVLGGSGEEEKKLRKLAKHLKLESELSFSGWVEQPKVFMESLDIFCLPSLHEPFGIVLLEAMVSKVPIVTTDSEGPREIIMHTQNGVMVHKADATALADGLAWMLDDESRARGLASEAYHTLKTRYTIERISAHMSESLYSIVTAFVEHHPQRDMEQSDA